ncbi:MAG: hypothetical protein GF411_19325 [Candidatus Lokiarchaeota archaeon]|nr:hypothetical protein [Candidatus Lokiarchaeota archaeon]
MPDEKIVPSEDELKEKVEHAGEEIRTNTQKVIDELVAIHEEMESFTSESRESIDDITSSIVRDLSKEIDEMKIWFDKIRDEDFEEEGTTKEFEKKTKSIQEKLKQLFTDEEPEPSKSEEVKDKLKGLIGKDEPDRSELETLQYKLKKRIDDWIDLTS